MQLALGTVQFGLDYGVSNTQGQVDIDELAAILNFAQDSGIKLLDTALQYGDAQKRLGQLQAAKHFKIISKLTATSFNNKGITEQLETTLSQLQCPQITGVMFHDADELLASQGKLAFAELEQCKSQGLTQSIGVSVYKPEQLIAILERFELDLVQLPFNCLDQRFVPLFSQLEQLGIEVHCRSLFLQGLLLMEPEQRPSWFQQFQPQLDKFEQAQQQAKTSKLTTALAIGEDYKAINYGVIGCTSVNQLAEIITSHKQAKLALNWPQLASDDEQLLLPYNWQNS